LICILDTNSSTAPYAWSFVIKPNKQGQFIEYWQCWRSLKTPFTSCVLWVLLLDFWSKNRSILKIGNIPGTDNQSFFHCSSFIKHYLTPVFQICHRWKNELKLYLRRLLFNSSWEGGGTQNHEGVRDAVLKSLLGGLLLNVEERLLSENLADVFIRV
jgi:hypothetical protein